MTLTYRLQRDEHSDIVPCDSCGCEAPTHAFERHGGEPRMLCEFCSTTMASRHNEYPPADVEDRLRKEIWQAAACVYNMLAGRELIEYKAVEAKPIDPADLL